MTAAGEAPSVLPSDGEDLGNERPPAERPGRTTVRLSSSSSTGCGFLATRLRPAAGAGLFMPAAGGTVFGLPAAGTIPVSVFDGIRQVISSSEIDGIITRGRSAPAALALGAAGGGKRLADDFGGAGTDSLVTTSGDDSSFPGRFVKGSNVTSGCG